MNERIRELFLQADFPKIDIENEAERFAELIVRECIKSTLSLHDVAIKHEWSTEETFHIIVDDMVEQFDMQHIFRS